MRWTHHIESVLIDPTNQRDMKISDTLENEYIYAYRKTLDGGLTLIGDDYLLIESYKTTNRFDKFTYEIRDNGTLNSSYEFTIEDCHFYPRTNTVTIKVTPRDIYTAIQENEDIEVNVIVGEKHQVSMDVYSYIYIELKTRADVTPFTAPADETYRKLLTWYTPINVNNLEDYVYWALYASERIIVPNTDIFNNAGWDLLTTMDDYKVYRRFPVGFDPTISHVITANSAIGSNIDLVWITGDGSLYNQDVNDWRVTDIDPIYDVQSWIINNITYKPILIKQQSVYLRKSYYNNKLNAVYQRDCNGYLLKDCMTEILVKAMPSFVGSIMSNFLFQDSLPVGSNPAIGNGYDKYLIEITDFKKYNASQSATKGMTTFKQAIEFLCLKHQLRWGIDSDGNLRIEHISHYKTTAIGLDKISDVDMIDDYSFVQNDKPNREYQTESNAYNEDFGQIEIVYGSIPALNGVKENTKTRSISNFYTDVDGLNTHLDELPDTGFVLVDVVAGAIVKGTGFKSGETNLQNASLSNANCLNLYYRHEAYQQEFTIGGRAVSAITLKKMRKHTPDFTSDSMPDVKKNIITSLGIGEVEKLTYPLTEEYTFNAELRYE